MRPVAVWTRPTPDRDADFIKPSYIPTPIQPSITPGRQDSPIYAPVTPEFRPAELPVRWAPLDGTGLGFVHGGTQDSRDLTSAGLAPAAGFAVPIPYHAQ